MKTFTIWDIRNKYLRTAVAWPLAIGCGGLFALAVPFILIFLAGLGIYDGLRDGLRAITGYEWRELGRTAWRALTAREAA